MAHPLGYNPLECMGVGKRQLRSFDAPQYYLCEWEGNKREWVWYKDYTDPVKLPPYLPDPEPDISVFSRREPLSTIMLVWRVTRISDDGLT